MSRIDEPALQGREATPKRPDEAPPLAERIRALVEGELYGVLCTQGSEQPYGSLVALAFDADLTAAAFATPITTRKFQLLLACDRVSLVIDNRPKFEDDMTRIEAVTVTGRAVRLEPGADFERWAERLLDRHGYLRGFLAAPSTALFRVDVTRFFHVERFQEVRQWIPARPG
ncbi:MAG: pyridoxamine 5'-phosphate oxidase family protein [Myxococcales bacterium]|nr:pyridoxamine 5'-phosphate oxidase family protein [Myxococcales bacterium]